MSRLAGPRPAPLCPPQTGPCLRCHLSPPPPPPFTSPCCVGRVSSASRPCIQQVGRSERCLLPTFPRFPHKRWGEVNDAFCQPSPATHANSPIHLPTPIHPHPPTTPSGLSLSLPFCPYPARQSLAFHLTRSVKSAHHRKSPRRLFRTATVFWRTAGMWMAGSAQLLRIVVGVVAGGVRSAMLLSP